MKLLNDTARAALRLANPAQRVAWASEQLYAACFPSPAVAANPALGIPAKPAVRGLLANSPIQQLAGDRFQAITFIGQPFVFTSQFNLPFDLAQFNRGVPLLSCIGELIPDSCLPYVGTIASGAPIPDNSIQPTVERYLVEQFAAMILATPTYDKLYSKMRTEVVNWFTSEYGSTPLSTLVIEANLERTGQVGNDRYADILRPIV